MKKYCAVMTAAIILWYVPATGVTQPSREENPLLLNSRKAPLKLKLSPNRRYIHVGNRSDKMVTSYRLGCAVKEAGEVKIKYVFDARKVELKPLDTQTNSMYVESFGVELSGLGHCSQMSTMLAVAEVMFFDETVWKADEHFIPPSVPQDK